MTYEHVQWPESQLFMDYVDLPIMDPNKCYWAQDSQDLFVPTCLYQALTIAIYDDEDSSDE